MTNRIVVEMIEGKRFKGDSANEVVTAMRNEALGGENSAGIRGYMKQVAKRVRDWNGKQVRFGSCEKFLADLEEAGVLRRIVAEGVGL